MPDDQHHLIDDGPCLAVRVPADGSTLQTVSLQIMEGPRKKTQKARWPHLDPLLNDITPIMLEYHVFEAK